MRSRLVIAFLLLVICMLIVFLPPEARVVGTTVATLNIEISLADVAEGDGFDWINHRVVCVSEKRCIIAFNDGDYLLTKFLFFNIIDNRIEGTISATNGGYIISEDAIVFVGHAFCKKDGKVIKYAIPAGAVLIASVDCDIDKLKSMQIGIDDKIYVGPEGFTKCYTDKWWVFYSGSKIILLNRKTYKSVMLISHYGESTRVAVSDNIVIINRIDENDGSPNVYANHDKMPVRKVSDRIIDVKKYYNGVNFCLGSEYTAYQNIEDRGTEWHMLSGDIDEYIGSESASTIIPANGGVIVPFKAEQRNVSYIFDCKNDNTLLKDVVDGAAQYHSIAGHKYISSITRACDGTIRGLYHGKLTMTVYDEEMSVVFAGGYTVVGNADKATIAAGSGGRVVATRSYDGYRIEEAGSGGSKILYSESLVPENTDIIGDKLVVSGYIGKSSDAGSKLMVRVFCLANAYFPMFCKYGQRSGR